MSDVMEAPEELEGPTKVAVLMMTLGPQRSAMLLRQMDEPEVELVLGEVSRLGELEPALIDDVIESFARTAAARSGLVPGGAEYARAMLDATFDTEVANALATKIGLEAGGGRFRFLSGLNPDQLISLIENEHPQTISVVMAHLDGERSAKVLAGFEDELQRNIGVRLATMERTDPVAIDTIEATLARKVDAMAGDSGGVLLGGVDSIVAMLSNSEKAIEKAVVEEIAERDADLAEEIKAQLFTFEDIMSLDDRAVQQVLRQVNSQDLATALKGASKAMSDKILNNMSSRASTELREEIELLPKLRGEDIKEARKSIVRVVRALDDSGEIVIQRGNDDFVD